MPTASTLPVGRASDNAPPGYVSFCLRFANECHFDPNGPTSVKLTSALWQTIQHANNAVNRAVNPAEDLPHHGRAEYWTLPVDAAGDCEDYALAKRHDLIEAGLPASALRIAIVTIPDGQRHAVLTIATDRGDFVLDNLSRAILPWNDTNYRWLERQDPRVHMGWVSLDPTHNSDRMPSASIRRK